MSGWLERIPRIEAESALLTSVFQQSVVDLAALRVTGDLLGEDYVLPAAGLPWFMTLFGRDTLITSLQTLWVGPRLARRAPLARRAAGHARRRLPRRGARQDPARGPSGELTQLGEKPHSPYYGTADATPLWLILLSEYWRFTGEDAFVLGRWDKVAAALAWIDRYGDRDGDGYVEYQTRSREGLGNQCWKDSWDGIQFADGTIPHLPIATAEIQAYVYDAKLRVAELARHLRADLPLAERLEREAQNLYARFNEDFWSGDRGGYYVVGLDADKRRIDSMTSNMGHLLWSGSFPTSAQVLSRHSSCRTRCSRAGASARCRPTIAATTRSATTSARSGRTTTPSSPSTARRLPRGGEPDHPGSAGGGRLHRLPSAGGVRRLRALGQPLPVPYPTACSPRRGPPGPPSSSCRRCSVSKPARAYFGSTHACPRRSAVFPFAGCMRSARSGTSKPSTPTAAFAAPTASSR